MMSKQRTPAPAGIWSRTSKTLGKWWRGMITLPDRPSRRELEADYLRFPWF